ncbi:MAG: DUF4347 domain-containing protein [Cyanobacteria bacterium P01_F01_bin.56]
MAFDFESSNSFVMNDQAASMMSVQPPLHLINPNQPLTRATADVATDAPSAIAFIDSAVDDLQRLVRGVVPQTRVIVLAPNRDGVEQMTEVLANYRDVATIHIVSHGAPGCLYLGNSQLSLSTLNDYTHPLQTALTGSASLLLYGCNVAAGDAGTEFIQKLHQLTGAAIAASAHRTGSTLAGGNWELEVRTGEVVPSLAFRPQVMATYTGVFSEPNDTLAQALDTGLNGAGFFTVDGAIGDNPTTTSTDVDLYQLEVNADDLVNVSISNSGGPGALSSLLRFFDASGNEVGSGELSLSFIAPTPGTYFVGVSGSGNNTYDPTVAGSGSSGSTGDYAIDINVATFEGIFNLADLDGSNGFVIEVSELPVGILVSNAGDINNDGFDDIIIGAPSATPNGQSFAGESYVVFGSDQPFAPSLDVSSLDGSNGFVLNGIDAGDFSGESVSGAGDINGDGFDDLIIGAPDADLSGQDYAGESYVVFGSDQGFAPSLDLSSLDGSNGFVIPGIDPGDFSGNSVSSAGDVNGDGFDDLIIGATNADQNGNDLAGESYVVFGSDQPFGASLELSSLDGSNGFVVPGTNFADAVGFSVSSAGDVNGDDLDDIIIGGEVLGTYVVFGSTQGFGASIDLSSLDGSNGFFIPSVDPLGQDVVSAAGDVNGDGLDDFIIGTNRISNNGASSGSSYVVFGSTQGFAPTLDLSTLDGSNGFRLDGTVNDFSGGSVSTAGDFNGDGLDDLIIGGQGIIGGQVISSSSVYLVFGSTEGFAPTLDLSTLDGSNGFRLDDPGINFEGLSVSGGGDIDGDGFDDLIISGAGETYVVFGRATASPVPFVFGEPATLFVDEDGIIQGNAFGAGDPYTGDLFSNTDGTANPDDAILGTAGDDTIWPGETGNDLIDAGEGNNTIGIGTGDSRVAAGAGDDFIYSLAGGGGTNLIDLGDGNNEAYLEAGDNDITTGAGNDLIGIGSGNDTVNAGDGDDFVYAINGGGGTNSLDLGDGANQVYVENGDYDIVTGMDADEIGLGTGNDTVNAGDGNNTIYMIDAATAGNKTITAGAGDDFIATGAGNDLIDAGLGFNTLNGGAGADSFTVRTGAYNFIGDFELGLDQIELADFAFAELSFFQGTGDVAADVFGFVGGEAVLQVANTTVAALDNTANFA